MFRVLREGARIEHNRNAVRMYAIYLLPSWCPISLELFAKTFSSQRTLQTWRRTHHTNSGKHSIQHTKVVTRGGRLLKDP